jgi:hypothetical protein
MSFLAPKGCPRQDCLQRSYQNGRYLVRGTVITPDEVIEPGEVMFDAKGISCVGPDCSSQAGYCESQLVETDGLIFPGLIDPHNHITYRSLPPWKAPKKYNDRCEWISSSAYFSYKSCHDMHGDESYQSPAGKSASYACIMDIYGEVAALMGGVTSVQSQLSDYNWDCVQGLVRNVDVDRASGDWAGDVADTCTFPIQSCGGENASCSNHDSIENDIDSCLQSWVPHVAEGLDCQALGEFNALRDCKDLLIPELALIHGTALRKLEFEQMAAHGSKLILSLRSNLALYGLTADLPTALEAYQAANLDDMVSISTDWCATGSCNFLDEFRCLNQMNESEWGGMLAPEEMVSMATKGAAHTLGLDDPGDKSCYEPVGRIAVGMEADLLVIEKQGKDNPYSTLLNASEDNVLLVFVGGRPLYGTKAMIKDIVANADLCENPSDFLGCNAPRERLICLDTPNYSLSLADTVAALKALTSQDPSHCDDPYPLWTCEAPPVCESTVTRPELNCETQGNPPKGCLRISEVMVNTTSGSSNKAGQYIELCNACQDQVDITGMKFTDGDSSGLDEIVAGNPTRCDQANWVCQSTIIPPGKCGVVLDPDYFAETNTDIYDFACPGTVILGLKSGTALGQGLSSDDPITLYDASGTLLTNIQDSYGTPACTDTWEDCDDDQLDCIPLDPPTGKSANRKDLDGADKVGNWQMGLPTPGCR